MTRRTTDEKLMQQVIADRTRRAMSNVLHAKTRVMDCEAVLRMHQQNLDDAKEALRAAQHDLDMERWVTDSRRAALEASK